MFVVDGVDICKYIFFVELNNVWVSDISNNFIFINMKCKNIYYVNYIGRGYGIYIVNMIMNWYILIMWIILRNC